MQSSGHEQGWWWRLLLHHGLLLLDDGRLPLPGLLLHVRLLLVGLLPLSILRQLLRRA